MGTLEYVAAQYIAEIDDRTLAHLQIVICNKLRRDERFTLRLEPGDGTSGPVTVMWLTSALPLLFTYSRPTRHDINGAWLQLLADAATSNAGLWVVPEPELRAPTSEQTARPERMRA
ncbi:hypothetical protein [Microbacterium sp.]|uniref:DUF7882 family protein n=1 Tax=Microbacterium sp. TaxID=51671 RepID=UPI002E33D9B7|nr:hypothetical protein [Microbacterium sp.]HEX5728421.1 hypothetical protein [Microbacterium sp.]